MGFRSSINSSIGSGTGTSSFKTAVAVLRCIGIALILAAFPYFVIWHMQGMYPVNPYSKGGQVRLSNYVELRTVLRMVSIRYHDKENDVTAETGTTGIRYTDFGTAVIIRPRDPEISEPGHDINTGPGKTLATISLFTGEMQPLQDPDGSIASSLTQAATFYDNATSYYALYCTHAAAIALVVIYIFAQ